MSEPASPDTSGLRGRSFRALLAASFATLAGYGVLLPVVALWAVEGGASTAEAGTATGVLMATTVASQLVVPRLLRRFGHRMVLVVGSGLLGLCGAAFAVSDALPVILTVAAIRGIGFGLLTVTGSAIVAELLPAELRGRGTGWYGIAVGVPQLLGLPAGVWLVDHVGFVAVFLGAGVSSLLGSMLALGIRPSDLRPTDGPLEHASSRTRAVLVSLTGPFAVMLVGAIGMGAFQTFAPIALANADWAPAALFVQAGLIALGRWLTGVVGDRYGRPTLLVPGVLGTCLGVLCLTLASQTEDGIGLLAALLGAALLGAGCGAIQNHTLVLMFGRVRRTQYGTASMVWNVGIDAGTGIGAVLVGVVADAVGFPWAFLLLGALSLLTLPPAVRARRERTGSN